MQYNRAQTRTVEANRNIDKHNSQIIEIEEQIKKEEGKQKQTARKIKSARSPNERQNLVNENKVLGSKLKKYRGRLKGYRKRLAKAVEKAQQEEQRLEKAYASFQSAEADFSPYARSLEKEEKKLSKEKAVIERAITDARNREQQKKLEQKLAQRRENQAKKNTRERERATKKLERELTLMKRERVKKARKEGRELSLVELDQWANKEKEYRDKLLKQYERFDQDTAESEANREWYQAAKSKLQEKEEEFYRLQNIATQNEKEVKRLRLTVATFEKRVKMAEIEYSEKNQLIFDAKDTDQEQMAREAVQAAEEHYIRLTTAIRKYRDQETESIKQALNTKRDLVAVREAIDLAEENYEKYRKRVEIHEKEEVAEAEYIRNFSKNIQYPGRAGPEGLSYQGVWPFEGAKKKVSIRSDQPAGNRYEINMISISGDKEAVLDLKNWSQYEADTLDVPISDADIENFRKILLKDLRNEGYVFAMVSVEKEALQEGILKFRVNVGEQGEVTVVGNRWHTADLILDSLSWETGKLFNYHQLYSDLFNINSRPDIRINTKLIPKIEEKGKSTIDVELNVIDRFPIHGSLKLSNTGVQETSDWRLRSTVQHLNLTQQNDITTLEWLTDPFDFQDVNAFSGSYHLPFLKGSGFTIYSGWSESNITDVAPDIDVFGEGYYVGAQYTKIIKSTDRFSIEATLGWLFQNVENFNEFAGEQIAPESDINLSMPSLTIGYSDKEFDNFGGRNFISNTFQINFSDKFGSSDKNDFGTNAEGSFILDRFQFARFQKLFSGQNEPGKWTLFFRFDAQVANEPLTPAVQKGFGGVNSIRGYEEREVSADNGFTGSLELQTPLISNFIPSLRRSEEYLSNNPDDWTIHRIQFIGFYDFGRSEKIDPLEGEDNSLSFSSIGAGIRLALTKYSQFSFDYGIPFVDTDESSGARAHVSLQVQF